MLDVIALQILRRSLNNVFAINSPQNLRFISRI